MSKTKSYFGVVICAFIASLFVPGLYNNIVFAASASISTTGTVSIDVSAAGNSANLGSDTLTVNTTCATGYTVSISSSIADATLYKDGDNTSTNKINPSTGTVVSPASILGNNLGTWGYSTTATSVQDNFIGLTNTPTIIKQSSTASGDGSGSATTGNDTIPVYYGVSIPTSLEPGTYTMAKDSSNNPGTIVYQLTMPTECQTYTIKYDGNGADSSTTMSVVNKNLNTNDTTTLMPSNYKRAGYGFAGWNTKADGTGENFGPMEDVTLSTTDTKGNALIGAADTNKEITLYAKWIQSAGNIQNWTGCSSLAQGAVTALTDTRDNNVYAVAKLADGNCWMIENLRLGGSSAMNLTTSNTGSTFTLPASTNTFATTSLDYTTIQMSAKNTLEATTNMTTPTNAEVYSYGNYYSWPAAIGSTTAYSTNNQSVSTSICPSGWHLPKGGDKNNTSNSEFWKLIVTGLNNGTNPANYSITTYPYYTANQGTNVSKLIRKYPNNFLYAGFLNGPSFEYRGSLGYYWSSTVNSSNNSYNLYFYSTYVYPATNGNGRYGGFSVRCVADKVAYLDTGANINLKLKSLASGTNVTSIFTDDTLITAFIRSDTLPANFVPSTANTISLANSQEPVYVWFDSNDGTMYYYSKANEIWMNVYSSDLFMFMKSLTNISGLKYFITDSVTDMSSMFPYTQISDITPITNWNVSNVTNMVAMFSEATSISDITPLANWNVGNVTHMNWMFSYTQISDLTPIANWDTSSVADMFGTFAYTSIYDLLPLSGWDVSNVEDMGVMFTETKISNLAPISGWDTSNVHSFADMFYDVPTLIDSTAISNWNVSKVDSNTSTCGNMAGGFFNTCFERMFGGSTPKTNLPIFTSRPGTWDSDGTYIPNP